MKVQIQRTFASLILVTFYLCQVIALGFTPLAHAGEPDQEVTQKSMAACYQKALLNSRAKCFLEKYRTNEENHDARLLASQCGCCLKTTFTNAFPDAPSSGGRNIVRCDEDPTSVYIALALNNDTSLSSYQAGIITTDESADVCFAQINVGTPQQLTKFRLPRIEAVGPGGQCINCHASTTNPSEALEPVNGLTNLGTCVPEDINPFAPKIRLTVVTDPQKAYATFDTGHRCPEEGCTDSYPEGNVVSVVYRPNPGWKVKRISGCDREGERGAECLVTMDAPKTVSASFEEDPTTALTLTVTKNGSGTGTVTVEPAGTSQPPGTTCGADCYQYNFNSSIKLKLTAKADPGSKFEKWLSGNSLICDDDTEAICEITISNKIAITASFAAAPAPYKLTVTKVGTGTVTASPSAPSCGADCYHYNSGTPITLTATEPAGGKFTGWTGCTASATDPKRCSFTMPAMAKSVTATFSQPTTALNVNIEGTFKEKVTGTGINCGNGASDCNENYPLGEVVTLNAVPDAGDTVKWTGCTTASGNVCKVTMPNVISTTAVIAKFVSSSVASKNTLNVTKAGPPGTGKVTGTGINCGDGASPLDCTEKFSLGAPVILTAVPTGGNAVRWSGCIPSNVDPKICTLTMPTAVSSAPILVTATFAAAPTNILKVTKEGTPGKVTGAGINCGDGANPLDCSENIPVGTASATLKAEPVVAGSLVTWSGCAPSSADLRICTVTMPTMVSPTPKSVFATFYAAPMKVLMVKKDGTSGKVTGPGINCGDGANPLDCSESVPMSTTSVTLKAEPVIAGSLVTWSGCTANGYNCTVTFPKTAITKTVTATFASPPPIEFNLTLAKTGTGTGTLSAAPAGASCGTNCYKYPQGTKVTLTAVPTTDGSTFTKWTGVPCNAGTPPTTCTFIMPAIPFTQTGVFDKPTATYTLSVVKGGSGYGKVTSDPAGIDCSTQGGGVPSCTKTFSSQTTVTLTAKPESGSVFDHWTGTKCSGNKPCTFSLKESTTETAIFISAATPTITLNVVKSGPGSGTITASPPGTSCGPNCYQYSAPTMVKLTPSASGGSTFAGWSGGGCKGDGSCDLMMSASTTVTGTFNSNSGTTAACNITKAFTYPSKSSISFTSCKASTLTLVASSACAPLVTGTFPTSTPAGESVSGGNVARYYTFTPSTTTGIITFLFSGGSNCTITATVK